MMDEADKMVGRLLEPSDAIAWLRKKYPKRRLLSSQRCTSHGRPAKGTGRLSRCYREKGHEGTHIARFKRARTYGVQVW